MGVFGISCRLVGASAAVLLAQTGVSATNAGAGVVVGQGTISPALTMSPQPVTGGFAGSAVGGGVVDTTSPIVEDAPNGCSFSFASTGAGDDLNTGQGTASGACNGTASLAAPSLTYSRTGPVVVINGSGTANGVPMGFSIECEFIPTSAPDVGSFALLCAIQGDLQPPDGGEPCLSSQAGERLGPLECKYTGEGPTGYQWVTA